MTARQPADVVRLAMAMTLVVAATACSKKDDAPPAAAQAPTAMPAKTEMTGEDVPGRAMVMLSGEQRQLINIRTTPVVEGPARLMIRTVGIVAYDDARVANVNTKVMGWVEKLYVDKPGQAVQQGAPLMDLYSPALYSAQQEYLLAFQQYRQIRTKSAAPKTQMAEASSLRESARKRLALWGISAAEIAAIEKCGEPNTTLQLKSPVTGVVVEKKLDPGQMVQPGMMLFRVADLSTVWINADVYEYELPLIQTGQPVVVTLTAYPDRKLDGAVDFIYPYLENKTRTTTVRVVLPNPEGLLKPGMYANAEFQRDLGKQLLIPAAALFNTGIRQYVFVQAGEGLFMPRAVQLGPQAGDLFVIRKGLKAGELVVVDGTFLLDSESQLRAGSDGGAHQH
jgi:Cu(I)/Ag(I) efflux system membrane fusion protein